MFKTNKPKRDQKRKRQKAKSKKVLIYSAWEGAGFVGMGHCTALSAPALLCSWHEAESQKGVTIPSQALERIK